MNSEQAESTQRLEIATLGGGCFWCIEAIFNELKGVKRVESGYAGGKLENPTYKLVCTGLTGHAEVIQVYFAPDKITFHEILHVFFTVHDPTTLNRQGGDVGTQYRSVIFYHDEAQNKTIHDVIVEIEAAKIWPNPIVTEVTAFEAFYKAEDYHQRYYEQNIEQPYCQFVIEPKLAKFRQKFIDKLKR